jgi:hypothetical protein
MPAERLPEVLHLKHALGMSYRRISSATGASETQAADYVRRAAMAGVAWPIPAGLDDAELERRLSRAPMPVRARVAPSIGRQPNVS